MPESDSTRPENFLHRVAAIDLRSLAAFRIGLGLVLVWDLLVSLRNVKAFYSNEGFLPLTSLAPFTEDPWLWSIHTWSGSAEWQMVLLAIHLIAAVCLVAGYRTQVSVFICWLLLSSLQVRNPLVLHSGDVVVRLLCFWSVFLPLGACWSVDAHRRSISVFRADGRVATGASLGILVQTCLIYWMGCVLKNGDEWLKEGTAVYYALSLDQFVTATGKLLLPFPGLCKGLTFATWWLELLGPIAAFFPWWKGRVKTMVVAAFWLLHIAFALCLRVGPFAPTMMSAWLLFLPSSFWDALKPSAGGHSPFSPTPGQLANRHRWMSRPLAQGFAMFCLVYVILWNLRGARIGGSARWLPQWSRPFGYVLNLRQYWTMFAPRPVLDDGWLVMEAVLADGSHVDLLRGGRLVAFEKPALISAEFRDSKWQKAILNLWPEQFSPLRPVFGNYMAFQWNGCHSPAQQIRGWTLWFMREDTPPRGHLAEIVKVELLRTGSMSGQ